MLQLQLSVTLGDLIVAGATICAIVGAYYAVKGQLETTRELLKSIDRRLNGHDEDIDALEERVFGRRKSDRRRKLLTAHEERG